MKHQRIFGDCRDSLASLEAGSVQCCVTSPPYWGLRSYLPADHPLKAREIGAEKTPEEFVAALVDVFRGVRRVLRDDGVLWLNLGDTYASGTKGSGGSGKSTLGPNRDLQNIERQKFEPITLDHGAKPKDLLLIPYRVAMALQADGWYLRASIPWVKANVMPASVTDRPTVAHESIFLLTKSARYFYDADAVRVEHAAKSLKRYEYGLHISAGEHSGAKLQRSSAETGGIGNADRMGDFINLAGRNRRTSDWWNESIALAIEELQAAQAGGLFHDADGAPLGLNVNTRPYPGAHFAVFPPKLAEPCVKAGTSERGCCPDCRAPWVRVVERGGLVSSGPNALAVKPRSGTGSDHRNRGAAPIDGYGDLPRRERTTTGFRPSCKCPEKDPVPCTVLDPFGGSGTTAQVAERLGRNSVVCELDERCDALMDGRLGKQLTISGAA